MSKNRPLCINCFKWGGSVDEGCRGCLPWLPGGRRASSGAHRSVLGPMRASRSSRSASWRGGTSISWLRQVLRQASPWPARSARCPQSPGAFSCQPSASWPRDCFSSDPSPSRSSSRAPWQRQAIVGLTRSAAIETRAPTSGSGRPAPGGSTPTDQSTQSSESEVLKVLFRHRLSSHSGVLSCRSTRLSSTWLRSIVLSKVPTKMPWSLCP
jgi:hypothetical protein